MGLYFAWQIWEFVKCRYASREYLVIFNLTLFNKLKLFFEKHFGIENYCRNCEAWHGK